MERKVRETQSMWSPVDNALRVRVTLDCGHSHAIVPGTPLYEPLLDTLRKHPIKQGTSLDLLGVPYDCGVCDTEERVRAARAQDRCRACDGEGTGREPDEYCRRCGGSGREPVRLTGLKELLDKHDEDPKAQEARRLMEILAEKNEPSHVKLARKQRERAEQASVKLSQKPQTTDVFLVNKRTGVAVKIKNVAPPLGRSTLPKATGSSMDHIARNFDIVRKPGESDDSLRARVIASVRSQPKNLGRTMADCGRCLGSGIEPGSSGDFCGLCGGAGKV